MPRTTDQWEALLDGTTPGPWREDSDDGILGRRKGEVENWELDPVVGHLCRDSDNTLASAAPEAVAEVIRLRRAMEALRAFVDGFPLAPPLVGMGSIEDRAREMQSAASDALTRILEGGNDE